MYKRLRQVFVLFVLACAAIALSGCGKSKGAATGAVEIEGLDVDAPQIDESALLGEENLLTGVNDLTEEAVGKRPVAVMVNNVEAALPQYGISQADIIFEIPVEGNQTRFMALYGDYTQVPKICSLRSCRDYFPALAKGFDAFYVHWGQDQTIASYLQNLYPDRFNGMSNTGGLFGRDTARRSSGYALEHTGYFDGTGLVEVIEKKGLRSDLEDNKKGTAFKFHEVGTVVKPEGEACNKVHIEFGAATATLTYDAESNTYLKKINGDAQVDGKTGEQLAFTNVFVLETKITTRDAKGHKDVDWNGSKSAVGYYISNGVVQKIHWSKADEKSYLKFYDENGEELVINRGKSYIAINNANKATFE